MSDLAALLEKYVAEGAFPGVVALVDRSGEVEVAAVGSTGPAGSAAMRAHTLFRLSSVTKPVTAAAVLALVDDSVLTLDAPIARRLPELASSRPSGLSRANRMTWCRPSDPTPSKTSCRRARD